MPDTPDTTPPSNRRRQMPPWLNLVLRLSITAALLAYALKGVDWPKFTALLLQAGHGPARSPGGRLPAHAGARLASRMLRQPGSPGPKKWTTQQQSYGSKTESRFR
jgi:hypothetical protein